MSEHMLEARCSNLWVMKPKNCRGPDMDKLTTADSKTKMAK